ncbi:MAG TPA: dihydroorotate dehydrogenase electron transfer subunit [Methanothrix sp.]|jgi:dihydroorotate dehydrogenase electron transfer subunit|uniref:dihydroorotate dehydrogenase electron transfer subunit n=1 Tax=Methanothrix sp. TaxID=90426 RepID=UPI002C63BBA2|nr:dihydroorotate dehydrogenase electron transfer subunit [Methanothrix sp.]MDI9416943.1 dihydroorotate dehydrogenase electron transfer subunit [Euryarchaeota archaeon]HON37045.1 dihydroorotate dehydrogenase electron transfer subunit [Methanothrix sp.]HRU76704.1 dihydroorotate dehydrogenase electron transfer subunit [Methanothrix sp.]
MRPIDVTILDVVSEAPQIKTLWLDRDLDPYPGQYAMLWIRGLDEVPMSFSGPDSITVQSVGEASEALTSLGKGESIGLRGPLGRGFTILGERILIIGGGVGVAPLAFLGEQAADAGREVTSLLGYRCCSDMIFLERFQRLGRTVVTTDDGSSGICGRVSAGLEALDIDEYDQIYLCGPEMMMWDVISKIREQAEKIQACINRYFKCAAGICGSCCLDPEGIRVCVEGPVIRADRLLESEFGRYRRGPTGGKGPCRG